VALQSAAKVQEWPKGIWELSKEVGALEGNLQARLR
jgi:hypothetical protein